MSKQESIVGLADELAPKHPQREVCMALAWLADAGEGYLGYVHGDRDPLRVEYFHLAIEHAKKVVADTVEKKSCDKGNLKSKQNLLPEVGE